LPNPSRENTSAHNAAPGEKGGFDDEVGVRGGVKKPLYPSCRMKIYFQLAS
jgi:hypothetical protein